MFVCACVGRHSSVKKNPEFRTVEIFIHAVFSLPEFDGTLHSMAWFSQGFAGVSLLAMTIYLATIVKFCRSGLLSVSPSLLKTVAILVVCTLITWRVLGDGLALLLLSGLALLTWADLPRVQVSPVNKAIVITGN